MACMYAVIGGAPLEKGQGTAIVTGAISIIFGVRDIVTLLLYAQKTQGRRISVC